MSDKKKNNVTVEQSTESLELRSPLSVNKRGLCVCLKASEQLH